MTEIKYEEPEESVRNETRSGTNEIRQRLKTTQNLNESQTRPVPSPSNDSWKKIVIDELTNAYHKFYSQQPTVKTWVKIFGGLVAVYLISLLLPSTPPSPFFHEFVQETNQVFEQISSVDLPASNAIMKHTVSCRNAANMVQHSPAFEKHGSQIASGLREFGEKIMIAGRNLQNMYNKGSSVYNAFDVEIEAMMERLNPKYMRQGNAKYFKERLDKLTSKVQEFRRLVEKTQSSIQDAEEIRHDTEGYIHDGLREAEKFIGNNVPQSQQSQIHVDVMKAEKELMFVSNLLDHLTSTAVHLDMIRKILANYEDKLLDVESELGNVNNDESIFEVTKEDLKYLKYAITNVKSCHNKFQKLSD